MISKYASPSGLNMYCLTHLPTIFCTMTWPLCSLSQDSSGPHCVPTATEPNINVLAWLMPLATGPLLSSCFTTQPHEHVTPRTQHCLWRVYSFVLSTLPLLEASHSFFESRLRATSTVELPAPTHRQTLGLLLQSFLYSFCFRVLYIIDVYNSISPNKLQAPLRQELFPWYLKSLAHCKHSILN